MTMSVISQGCYASAMVSLDWLDHSYSPLKLTEKYKLPLLVRITEGYYGNTNNTCFSAMDVVKLHDIHRIDMIVAKLGTECGIKDPDASEPIRICFPKSFAGHFDPIHQTGDKIEGPCRKFKNVRELAEYAPHFVRVVKKPCKKEEIVNRGDTLETLGLSMCSGYWEKQGFLRCRKQDGDEVLLNLNWKGQFETLPDPRGYMLQDVLRRFALPCKVTLRMPESHLLEGSDLNKFLPQLRDVMVLEREITQEFLVGTTVDLGSARPQNPVNQGESSVEAPEAPFEYQQSSVVVLSKNASVLFQICQDMVHKRGAYTSLLEMFGECLMDKIPLDLFICEYAAPFVAFTRKGQTPTSRPISAEGSAQTMRPPHSRSLPDLTSGKSNEDVSEEIVHHYANPERGKSMTQRALPPLPHEIEKSKDTWQTRHGKVVDASPGIPLPGVCRYDMNRSNEDMTAKADVTATSKSKQDADKTDFTPYTDPIDLSAFVAWRPAVTTSSLERQNIRRRVCPKPGQPVSGLTLLAPLHPDPPADFKSAPLHVQGEQDNPSIMVGTRRPGEAQLIDPAGLPPPTRNPPPPPPRTTPKMGSHESDHVYGNIEGSSDTSSPLTPKSSPPATLARAPPLPKARLKGMSADDRDARRGSHSFNTSHDLSCPVTNRSDSRHHTRSHTEPSVGSRPPQEASNTARPSSIASGGYLQPLLQTDRPARSRMASSCRSNSTGMLLEEVDISGLCEREVSKTISAPTPSRPITSPKPTCRIKTVGDIPSNINNLSTTELAQCLRLLNMDKEIIHRFHKYQINGSLLVQLTTKTVRNELDLTDFEAEKLDAFRKGWRPDDEA